MQAKRIIFLDLHRCISIATRVYARNSVAFIEEVRHDRFTSLANSIFQAKIEHASIKQYRRCTISTMKNRSYGFFELLTRN